MLGNIILLLLEAQKSLSNSACETKRLKILSESVFFNFMILVFHSFAI